MIEKGVLGKVTNVQAQWHRNTFAKRPLEPSPARGLTDKGYNWRKYREFSGGLTAELGSHQIDVADWMFGATPEFVVGVGGHDHVFDGRDIYDNIQLIFKYPQGQKLMYSAIGTNQHLSLFGGTRSEFGEVIMGTEGTIEITVGGDAEPAIGLWFSEPKKAQVTPAAGKKEPPAVAGATLAGAGAGSRGMPILLDKDQIAEGDSFLQREMKFARRWLAAKGVMTIEEDKNPVMTPRSKAFSNPSARARNQKRIWKWDSPIQSRSCFRIWRWTKAVESTSARSDKMGRDEAPKKA
jgi:hypothetical protein